MTTLMMAALLFVGAVQETQPNGTPKGEQPVKPYEITNENAGAEPYPDDDLFQAFHGMAGLKRISDDLVMRLTKDERIKGIFRASDLVRLRRTLAEQFCYVLGGGCDYTGRDMRSVHKDHGITQREFLILVEHLQLAMNAEGVPFAAQNKLLAKLAPMHRDIIRR